MVFSLDQHKLRPSNNVLVLTSKQMHTNIKEPKIAHWGSNEEGDDDNDDSNSSDDSEDDNEK